MSATITNLFRPSIKIISVQGNVSLFTSGIKMCAVSI